MVVTRAAIIQLRTVKRAPGDAVFLPMAQTPPPRDMKELP